MIKKPNLEEHELNDMQVQEDDLEPELASEDDCSEAPVPDQPYQVHMSDSDMMAEEKPRQPYEAVACANKPVKPKQPAHQKKANSLSPGNGASLGIRTSSPTPSTNEVSESVVNFMNDYGDVLKKHLSNDCVKKPQPEYLKREVEVDKSMLDVTKLVKDMTKDLTTKLGIWVGLTKRFKLANLVVTIFIIIMQIVEVIVFQVPELEGNPALEAIATIFPAITGAALAIQLKLNWVAKAEKAKRNAKLYQQLLDHLSYRKEISDANATLKKDDMVKFWNVALKAEVENIPPFLYIC